MIPYEQAIVGGKSSLLMGRDQTQGGVVTCCYKYMANGNKKKMRLCNQHTAD